MNRGAVVLAPFTYSNLEQLKRRPACVVSTPPYNEGPDVILAMVTSSRHRLEHPGLGDVLLQEWRGAGLLSPSVVRTGRLLVLERRLLAPDPLGQLTPRDLAAVDQGLAGVLGL